MIAGIDVGGTFTDLIVVDRRAARCASPRCRRRSTTRPSACSPRSTRPSVEPALARGDRPRHDDDDQRDARAQDRDRRPDHDARLSRRARARPPHPADALRPEGPLRAADRARAAARGRRAHRRRGRGAGAARRGAGRGRGAAAARARRRERRHPLPAQLHQPGARGARRRDRARALAEPLRDRGPHDRRRVPRVRARHDGGGERRDPAGAAPLHRAAAERARGARLHARPAGDAGQRRHGVVDASSPSTRSRP